MLKHNKGIWRLVLKFAVENRIVVCDVVSYSKESFYFVGSPRADNSASILHAD